MTTIKYIVGDALDPKQTGNVIIPHVVNSVGGWGRGFVLSLSAKWKQPEFEYRSWMNSSKPSERLGEVQFVKVTENIWVANMCCQTRIGFCTPQHPNISYQSLKQCLEKVADFAIHIKASISAPRFGCGLAGGSWNVIEKMINDEWCSRDIGVTIYDFKGGK